jgi:hypothetical protein
MTNTERQVWTALSMVYMWVAAPGLVTCQFGYAWFVLAGSIVAAAIWYLRNVRLLAKGGIL